ncbi:hypothetical protein K3495_g14859 [Podosphaera aphanis]|nr:hypothetical protein K3495_g14859 [Podosphaera aphanis]
MQRQPIARVGNTALVIPRDADPRRFLPIQYHDYLDVFDKKQAEMLPPHRPWDHAIDLQHGKQPPAARPYSMNQNELKALRTYLEKELSKGFIRVSRSPAAAPVLFVKKSNGDLRFCIDYRGLNAITIRNRHSLPLISETLSQLSHARYYSKLDIISAFNKPRIKEGDEWKAAFTCRYGLFEPTVLPFGVCNGPASFQSYINHALRGLLDNFWTAYMDDILIYSENLAEHRHHVKTVLQRLREQGLQADIRITKGTKAVGKQVLFCRCPVLYFLPIYEEYDYIHLKARSHVTRPQVHSHVPHPFVLSAKPNKSSTDPYLTRNTL